MTDNNVIPIKPMVTVDAEALRTVLQALMGPPHHIRELLAIRGLPGVDDHISTLINQYNTWAERQ